MDTLFIFIKVILWISLSQNHLPLAKISELAVCVTEASERFQVDPAVLTAIITRESGWHEDAVSKTHDWGLCQAHVKKPNKAHTDALLDGCTNIHIGARILKRGLSHYNPGSPSYVGNTMRKANRLERILK